MDIIIWYLFWGLLPLFAILYIIINYVIIPIKGIFYKNLKNIKQ